jgi:hypothetical protein
MSYTLLFFASSRFTDFRFRNAQNKILVVLTLIMHQPSHAEKWLLNHLINVTSENNTVQKLFRKLSLMMQMNFCLYRNMFEIRIQRIKLEFRMPTDGLPNVVWDQG